MMSINPAIFKAYDIRGVYPSDINEHAAEYIAKAIYSVFSRDLGKPSLSLVVGRDMRESSPSLFERFSDAIVAMGGTVIDIGIVPTPTVYFAVKNGGYDGGIQISASHNPGEYNGIKIVRKDGDSLVKIGSATGMDRIKDAALKGTFLDPRPGGKKVSKTNALAEEVDAAFDQVAPTIMTGLKVVVDAANAMGAPMLDELFRRTDIEVVRMNWDLDGSFPSHQADPLQFKLWKDLQKKVVAEGADFGIAPDGDGDRVFFVSEKGDIVPATLITALITKEILEKHPGERVLVDIRYIRNVEAVCKKYGGKMSVSKVGHALITDQLNREDAFYAGESSGHYYFKATGGAESSIRVILHLIHSLSESKKKLSALLSEFSTSVESGEVNFELSPGTTAKNVIDVIKKDYHDGNFSDLDGIAITYPDWRFSIRSSNTEPLLRLNVEGKEESIVSERVREVSQKIIDLGATIKD